jgi:hypothetical protein
LSKIIIAKRESGCNLIFKGFDSGIKYWQKDNIIDKIDFLIGEIAYSQAFLDEKLEDFVEEEDKDSFEQQIGFAVFSLFELINNIYNKHNSSIDNSKEYIKELGDKYVEDCMFKYINTVKKMQSI